MQPHKVPMGRKQFRIGDLADELKVKKFVIRFWEKEFDLKSDRSEGGQRFYTSDDLKTFLLIKDLLYKQGFTIAGAKKQLEMLLAQRAQEALMVHPQADAIEEVVTHDSVHDVTPAEVFPINEMVADEQEQEVAAIQIAPVQEVATEAESAPAMDMHELVAHEVKEESKAEEIKIEEMVQPSVEISSIEIISDHLEAKHEELKQEEAPLVSSGAELVQVEEQEEMVAPATVVPCACSAIGQELRVIKDKLLAIKQRVEQL